MDGNGLPIWDARGRSANDRKGQGTEYVRGGYEARDGPDLRRTIATSRERGSSIRSSPGKRIDENRTLRRERTGGS